MIRIKPPEISAEDSFTAALSSIRNTLDGEARQSRLLNAKATVKELARKFDTSASLSSGVTARGSDYDVPGLEKDDMVRLYDRQFSSNPVPRKKYQAILSGAPSELCPYCGVSSSRVSELDHYLPKTVYAGITVHPNNLVPTCRDCNKEKLDYDPGAASFPVLHPYFDSLDKTRWLHASLHFNDAGMPSAEFEVSLETPDPILESRLNAHLDVFNLRTRFATNASQKLSDFQISLQSPEMRDLTVLDAKRILSMTAAMSSGNRTNSCDRATFEAMANSDRFLSVYLGLK